MNKISDNLIAAAIVPGLPHILQTDLNDSYSQMAKAYDALGDQFPHWKVLLPSAAVLTALVHSGDTAWEIVWSYSLWLESIAFIPQIIMLQKIRVIENLTSHYVAMLGLYRLFYIFNW